MPLATGTYSIVNTGAALSIRPQVLAAGSYIVAGKDDYTENFKWILHNIVNSTFSIESLILVMYVNAGDDAPPTDVLLNTTEQHYIVDPVPGVPDTYTIKTIFSDVFLGLDDTSTGDHAKVIVGPRGSSSFFRWKITPIKAT